MISSGEVLCLTASEDILTDPQLWPLSSEDHTLSSTHAYEIQYLQKSINSMEHSKVK